MYLGDVMIKGPKKPLSYKDEGMPHSSGKSERPMGAQKGDTMWKMCLWSPKCSGTTQGKGTLKTGVKMVEQSRAWGRMTNLFPSDLSQKAMHTKVMPDELLALVTGCCSADHAACPAGRWEPQSTTLSTAYNHSGPAGRSALTPACIVACGM